MRLSPRLLKIAGLVPENSVVADIGTDHALLPVYLVVTGRCPRAIATDSKPGPLRYARETVKHFSVCSTVDLRLGYGLTVIKPHEVDVITIAGVGGRTIIEILEKESEVAGSARRLILQPMNHPALVRKWLISKGFRMVEEDLALEGGVIYEIIAAEPGSEPETPPEVEGAGLEVGPRLWEEGHPLLLKLIEQKCERLRDILKQMAESGLDTDPSAGERRARLRALETLLQHLKVRETPHA